MLIRRLRALLVLLLALPLLGQTVKLSNHGQATFYGYKRVTVDIDPPHPAGEMPDGTWYIQLALLVVARDRVR